MILHLVTDRRRLAPGVDAAGARACLLAQARHAIEAHIDHIHIRERDLEAADLAALVLAVVEMARGTDTKILVNDRVDVALACGAAGIHLRGDSIRAEAVRRIAPSGWLIGQSVHDVDEARRARGADYLVAGTVWPTASKPEQRSLLGVEGLARVCSAAAVPVLAIGGVTPARVDEVARAGAAGIAGIGLFMSDVEENVARCRSCSLTQRADALRRAFDTPGSGS